MKNDLLKNLTEEQLVKARACKNHEELMALAKAEGIELSEEQLASVSGGACQPREAPKLECPRCHSENTEVEPYETSDTKLYYRCKDCGFEWERKW